MTKNAAKTAIILRAIVVLKSLNWIDAFYGKRNQKKWWESNAKSNGMHDAHLILAKQMASIKHDLSS